MTSAVILSFLPNGDGIVEVLVAYSVLAVLNVYVPGFIVETT